MAALVLAPEAGIQTVPWQVPSLIPEVGQPLASWGSWGRTEARDIQRPWTQATFTAHLGSLKSMWGDW